MNERPISENDTKRYAEYLRNEEKSTATIEKYIRDVRAFTEFVQDRCISKEIVIEYKKHLIMENYATRSINSMLVAINGFLSFVGCSGCRVKALKIQMQIYCSEDKELTKAEYIRLVNMAKEKGRM